jgi:predicted DCC family thiol-disulfide oxidoreductase YuxK
MLTAIYDENCVICNTTRRLVRSLDWLNRVEFVNLHQRQQVVSRFPQLDYEQTMGQIHVVDNDGAVFAGFAGTRRMLRALPLLFPLYLILRLPIIGSWLGPKVYQFIADRRYTINRWLGVELEQIEHEEAACEDNICRVK